MQRHHTSLRGAHFTATVIPVSTHTHTRAMPSHATYYAISVPVPPNSRTPFSRHLPRHLTALATSSHAAISRQVPCHLMPRITPSHLTCHAVSRHVPLHLMHTILTPVNWRNVAESFWTIVVHCISCGRFTDHCGTLQCLTVHCGALHICYGRLVGHCGALWCVVVQCGNIVKGLRTITAHCGVLYMLWKAYRLLWYLAVPYNALRCIA